MLYLDFFFPCPFLAFLSSSFSCIDTIPLNGNKSGILRIHLTNFFILGFDPS